VRQGEVASKGAWIGNPLGGVKAPEALTLPDPAKRFSQTAARLEELSADHPLAEWLRFMAEIARAQHVAATTLAPFIGPDREAVEQAVQARIPPLAADGYRRDPVWRDGLTLLLGAVEIAMLSEQARVIVANLSASNNDAVEALAEKFLRSELDSSNAGAALYVAAALQVYFTGLAADLSAASLRLLPQRGLCPCCGSPPISGVVTASGRTPGARYLYCSLCATAWNHARAICITCGDSRSLSQRQIDGQPSTAKAETCNTCHTYAKMMYQAQDMMVDAFADDLATLGLDLMVSDAGWARHAPNPFVLIAPNGAG
jgi:FdhE protein